MNKIMLFIKRNYAYIVFAVCIILFVAIAEDVLEKEIMKIDVISYNFFIEKLRTPLLTCFMNFITKFGNATVLIALCVISFIVIKEKIVSLCITGNLIIITLINQLLKFIVQRLRPDGYRLIFESGYSFPSGHSMISVAFFGFLIYLIYKFVKNKNVRCLLYIILVSLILLICMSRIYLGVHYASDVIAGAIISIAYLVVFVRIVDKYIFGGKKMGKIINSFKYAFTGIASAFRTEKNMKIHAGIMVLVIIMGIIFKIEVWEWIVCIIWFSIVIGGELFNTAIEIAVNLAMPKINDDAKRSKDISAGGVLVFAIGSAIVGMLIFLPKIILLLS